MMMKLITLTLLITSIGCIKFDSPSSGGSGEGGVSAPTASTNVTGQGKSLEEVVVQKIKSLPSAFNPGVSAVVSFYNPNNVDLSDVHLNLRDVTGSNFYSGSAKGLSHQARQGSIKFGGHYTINVQQFRGNSEYQTDYDIKDGRLRITLY